MNYQVFLTDDAAYDLEIYTITSSFMTLLKKPITS